MSEIELFVCCHKPNQSVPKHPLLVPVQVGTALADKRLEGYLHDDNGENISDKNRKYCELTALYWAWKNRSADFVGLFHYRRYLYPNPQAKRPYVVQSTTTLEKLEHMGYSHMAEILSKYDVILPMKENMYVTVREHYATAPFHHAKDLSLIEGIIRKYYPAYIPAMEEYLSGTELYFGNIMVMKREVLNDYCQWLFDILGRFDQVADLTGYSPQELRVDGYLAERLLGIYISFQRDRLQLIELPRVHFLSGSVYWRSRVLHFFLPPGTKVRAFVKRWMK